MSWCITDSMTGHLSRLSLTSLFVLFSVLGCSELSSDAQSRRIALKEGLKEARSKRLVEIPEVGKNLPTEQVIPFLQRIKRSTLSSSSARQIKVDSRFEFSGALDTLPSVSDQVVFERQSHLKWSIHHLTDWRNLDTLRKETTRCIRIDSKLYRSEHSGAWRESVASDWATDHCVMAPIDLALGWIFPLADKLQINSVSQTRDLIEIRLLSVEDQPPRPLPLAFEQATNKNSSPSIFGPRGHLFSDLGQLNELAGNIKIDPRSFELVDAQIDASLSVLKRGQTLELNVRVIFTSDVFSGEISPPSAALMTSSRQRTLRDRQFLLGKKSKRVRSENLPKPGSSPKLLLGADGQLIQQSDVDEDRPVPKTLSPKDEEDIPE